MNSKYKKHFDFVEKTLIETEHDKGRKHPFRSRVNHIKRVYKWAERRCEGRDDYNPDVLFLSVIFHDVGYACGHDNHQINSEKIFREYAINNNFNAQLTEKIALCIGTHSDKELLLQPEKLFIEQILLMEADLLDEEGALAICWHGMAAGYEGDDSYEECVDRIKTKLQKRVGSNPMVTEKGRRIWDEKVAYQVDFVKKLEYDLEMEQI